MEGGNTGYSEYWKNVIFFILIIINHIRWAIKRFSREPINTYTCLVGKTAIITGGNSGLGYATTIILASRGCRVIIASNMDCETEKNKIIESTNNPNIITKYVDLASISSVRKFAENIKKTETKIDFLINNAGVGVVKNIFSKDGLNNVMQINYFGHFLLTHLLIDQLRAASSSRVVFVGSSGCYTYRMEPHYLHQVPNENDPIISDQYFRYYCNAKVCVIAAAKEFGEKLCNYGILVNSVDPGIFNSQVLQGVYENNAPNAVIFRWLFQYLVAAYRTDVSNGAQNTVYVLTGQNIENGAYYFRCKPIFKPYNVENPEFRRSIWEKTEIIVGLRSNEKCSWKRTETTRNINGHSETICL